MRWPPPPNPLTTVSVWIAALFMAIREGADAAGVFPAMVEAMSGAWSYLPLGVLVFSAIVYIVRTFLPERPKPHLGAVAPIGGETIRNPTAAPAKPVASAASSPISKPSKRQAYRLDDAQKRRLVELIAPLAALQSKMRVRRATAGSSNITMLGGMREVFERAGFKTSYDYIAPTAPNQEGLYICYDTSADRPPRLAAELALAFKEVGLTTNYAPLPPGSAPDEVVVYVGPSPL